ncbi:MAG: site-specific integrase [Spirosomataceae bacterium]
MFKPSIFKIINALRANLYMTSVKIVLFTSKILKNGEHPIMLRLTKNRKLKYINMGYSCSTELWDSKNNLPKRKHPLYQEIVISIDTVRNKANREILNLANEDKEYSLEELSNILQVNKNHKAGTIFEYFDTVIARKEQSGNVGYANAFVEAKNKLKAYRNGRDLEFPDITYTFLKQYEEWLIAQKLMPNTIFYYLRTLNTLLGYAKKEGLVKPDYYPFKEFGFAKYRNVKTKKRAIPKENMTCIIQLDLNPSSRLYRSRSFFIFSYYCGGINFVDMAHLKWSDIVNGRLHYARQKTGEYMNIVLLPPAQKILTYFRETNFVRENSYIFPILSDFHKTPTQMKDRIHKVTGQTNDDMKEIAKMLGIAENLTTYVARHSFATIQKKSGTPTAVISEMLGHDSEKTTRIYLDSFGNDVLDEAMKNLL